MCLPACLCTQIANTPFNYMITAQTLLAKCGDYRFQRLILQFPASGKKYRIASMFIITRAVSTPRDAERRESGSMFYETIEIISWSSKESRRKHENRALKVPWLNNEIHSWKVLLLLTPYLTILLYFAHYYGAAIRLNGLILLGNRGKS